MKKLHWTDSEFNRTYLLLVNIIGNDVTTVMKLSQVICNGTGIMPLNFGQNYAKIRIIWPKS